MAAILLVFGLIASSLEILTEEASSCPLYKCKDSSSIFPDASTCMIHNQTTNTYYVHPCDEGYICLLGQSDHIANCSYNNPHESHVKLAGVACIYDEDCYGSNTCVSGFCKGAFVSQKCSINEDCDVNLFCLNDVCADQVEAGKTGCLSDSDCVNNAGCDVESKVERSLNLCRTYFGLLDYESLQNCTSDGYINYLCDSGYCALIGEESQCWPAPVSKTSLPVKCSESSVCTSKPSGKVDLIFNTECGCGKNSFGDMYCGPFAGDVPYQKYSDIIKEWTKSSGILKCNTEGRFGTNCMLTYWTKDKAAELNYYYYYSYMYQTLYNAPDCVAQVYFPAYWGFKKDFDSQDLASILSIGALILIFN